MRVCRDTKTHENKRDQLTGHATIQADNRTGESNKMKFQVWTLDPSGRGKDLVGGFPSYEAACRFAEDMRWVSRLPVVVI